MTPTHSFEAEEKVSALAIAPGGSEIAALLKNGKLQISSTAGKLLRSTAAGEAKAYAIACTADGRRIVAGCGKSLHVFDRSTGERLRSWTAQRGDIAAIACSRDGSLLASTDGYEAVKLWKGDGSPIRTLGSGIEVLGIALSPSGDRVAEGASDTKLRLFASASGALQHSLEFPMACPVLAFSPDGRMLAAGSVDGSLSLLDAVSGEAKGILGRHAVPAGAAAFSADGRRLACTGASINPWGAEAELKVWDLATKREAATPIGVSFLNAVGFAGAHPIVASARDKTISVWEP